MRRLNSWLSTYMDYTRFSEAPDSFHFWTGVATIGAALRRKVRMVETYYSWSPNFYIVFVAKPGVTTKSTSISIGRRLLEQVPGIKFGPEAITWQALITTLSKATEIVAMPGGVFESMSCLTFTASEFGSLVDLHDRQMINVLVDLWDGKEGTWSKITKTRGKDDIKNPWLNIIAATTPSWLSDNLPKTMMGGGFTARCLFLFAEHKRQLVAYPSQLVAAHDINKLRDDLIHDLEQIAALRGDIKLTPDAYLWGTQWYAQHDKLIAKATEDRGGYMARKQAHMHKLAMVLSASRRDDLIIQKEDLIVAEKLLSAVEADMGRIFDMIQTTESQEKVLKLIQIVQRDGKVKKESLYRKEFITNTSPMEYAQMIQSAIISGYITERSDGTSIWLQALGSTAGVP